MILFQLHVVVQCSEIGSYLKRARNHCNEGRAGEHVFANENRAKVAPWDTDLAEMFTRNYSIFWHMLTAPLLITAPGIGSYRIYGF